MKYFKFQPEGTKNCSMTAYLQTEVEQENGRRKLPGVVICPGGGYEEVSRREGEPAAKPYFGAGFPQAAIWHVVWECFGTVRWLMRGSAGLEKRCVRTG